MGGGRSRYRSVLVVATLLAPGVITVGACGELLDLAAPASEAALDGSLLADQASADRQEAEPADQAASPPDAGGVKKIAVGAFHTCAILGDGRLKCWGSNATGALGLGDTHDRGDGTVGGGMGAELPAVDVGKSEVIDVAIGRSLVLDPSNGRPINAFTCAVLADGAARCWGSNSQGQLGRGNKLPVGTGPGEMRALGNIPLGAKAVRIVAGEAHACALLENGEMKCWGSNGWGQLGYGHTQSLGGATGEVEALKPVPLGGKATAIAAGQLHTCALLEKQIVKCWGQNHYGQLGLGDQVPRGNNDAGLPFVLLGFAPSALHAGSNHTCVVAGPGIVRCWGLNSSGQLGLGDTASRGQDDAGLPPPIQLGADFEARDLAAGFAVTCAVGVDARVKCWGEGLFGARGSNNQSSAGRGPREMGDALAPVPDLFDVTQAAAGRTHTCVISAGRVKCFGSGAFGKLGLGSVSDRGGSTNDMASLPFVDL